MAENKTKPTTIKPKDFIAALENDTRRKDAEALVKLYKKVTGWQPKMWGPTIIGFGSYDYTYDTGHSGSMCVVGFSPRTTKLVIYAAGTPAQVKKLGKATGGNGHCIYINKLADIDLAVLEDIVRGGVEAIKKKWKVRKS
jgi:hypothetical protein